MLVLSHLCQEQLAAKVAGHNPPPLDGLGIGGALVAVQVGEEGVGCGGLGYIEYVVAVVVHAADVTCIHGEVFLTLSKKCFFQ